MTAPDAPSAPSASSANSANFSIRYDDLTQHAHVKIVTLQLALGRLCFEGLWAKHPLFETRRQGIAPILSRMVLECEPVAVSFGAPLEARGNIDIAHERTPSGEVSALFMNGSAEVFAIPSRRNPAVDPSTRQPVSIGRAFGEHVLTRPFGPPDQRKVLQFSVPGQPALPTSVHTRVRVQENTLLPEGAVALDASFSPDETPWTFGLIHSDLNQHVNSLVYARLFEEAALRRAARHGRNQRLFARRLSLCYRKPCFVGESVVCMVQSYLHGGQFGAVGYIGPQGVAAAQANCSFQLQFVDLT